MPRTNAIRVGGRRIGNKRFKNSRLNARNTQRKIDDIVDKFPHIVINNPINHLVIALPEGKKIFIKQPTGIKYFKAANCFLLSRDNWGDHVEEDGVSGSFQRSDEIRKANKHERRLKTMISKQCSVKILDPEQAAFDLDQQIWLLQQPDILQVNGGDHYFLFGEFQLGQKANQSQIEGLQGNGNEGLPAEDISSADALAQAAQALEGQDWESLNTQSSVNTMESIEATNISETTIDVSEDDLKLVMGETNCSREAAISALQSNSGDLVNAIMELT